MKKLRTLLTILITLSLVVVGCSSKSKNDNKTDNSKGYKIGMERKILLLSKLKHNRIYHLMFKTQQKFLI